MNKERLEKVIFSVERFEGVFDMQCWGVVEGSCNTAACAVGSYYFANLDCGLARDRLAEDTMNGLRRSGLGKGFINSDREFLMFDMRQVAKHFEITQDQAEWLFCSWNYPADDVSKEEVIERITRFIDDPDSYEGATEKEYGLVY